MRRRAPGAGILKRSGVFTVPDSEPCRANWGQCMLAAIITPLALVFSWQRYERPGRSQIPAGVIATFCVVVAALIVGPPPEARAAKPRIVRMQAYKSQPFGVGVVEIDLPDTEQYTWQPDEFLNLESQKGRIWYPAFRWRPMRDGETTQNVTILFLTKGAEPLSLSLVTPRFRFALPQRLRPVTDGAGYDETLKEWWDVFCKRGQPGEPEEFRSARRYVQQMLARRLQRPPRTHAVPQVPVKSLEQQFERLVSLLFGFEAARLAMMADRADPESSAEAVADSALPKPMQIPSGEVPEAFRKPTADQLELARHVPADCFYMRCGQVSNYLWVRHLVTSWGGDLSDVVAVAGVDRFIRERLEKQLGLDRDLLIAMQVDKEVVDFALIGSDVYFHEGAAVGAVFQARSQLGLTQILETLRERFAQKWNAAQKWIEIDGHSVSLYTTPDHTMRSLYVTDGIFHLITNSTSLARRFLRVQQQGASLGERKEFQYALAQLSAEPHYAYIYLSDPFLRSLTSPQTRIEVSRRRRSMQELQAVVLAQAAARAEDLRAANLEALIRHGFLPEGFGARPDGSRIELTGAGPVDSKRGRLGAFLPIPDVQVDRVTKSERNSYLQFARNYQEELKAMDPVLLAFGCKKGATPKEQQVQLEVLITPCSQNAYKFLSQYLAPVPSQRVPGLLPGDVMGVSAVLRSADGNPVQVHAGIQDDAVTFKLDGGEVIRGGRFGALEFGMTHAYGAVHPGGPEEGRLLKEFISSVQNRKVAERLPMDSVPQDQTPGVIPWLMDKLFGPSRPLPQSGWRVTTLNSAVAQRVSNQLKPEPTSDNAQVHFKLTDVSESQIADYLNAHMYLRTRKVAAGTGLFLSQLAAAININIDEARSLIEDSSAIKIVDPFGGDYALRSTETQVDVLESTGMGIPRGSLYEAHTVPTSYRFAFLDWLRELNVLFTLTDTALQSRINLRLGIPELDPISWGIFQSIVPLGDSSTKNLPPPPLFVPGVLGVRVTPDLRVIKVTPNGPAAQAGIQEGDRIREVNGRPVKNPPALVYELKGRPKVPGTAMITVTRPGTGTPRELKLEADVSGAKAF